MLEMTDGIVLRQKCLWRFGLELWKVAPYPEECMCALNEAASGSVKEKEENGKVCIGQCYWHSPPRNMDEDGVVQD